jgi:hypothetical protein
LGPLLLFGMWAILWARRRLSGIRPVLSRQRNGNGGRIGRPVLRRPPSYCESALATIGDKLPKQFLAAGHNVNLFHFGILPVRVWADKLV